MAFLRFTRDKRGYEQFSLVEATTNRRGKSRTRLLYWYRTPPNVRVGREPFDETVRRALEAQNPGVQFDWRKIVETPIPSAETERWRERRPAEKAEKAARRVEAAVAARDERDERDEDEEAEGELSAAPDVDLEADAEPAARLDADGEGAADATAETTENTLRVEPATSPGARRRRRRRGRRGRPAGQSTPTTPNEPEGN